MSLLIGITQRQTTDPSHGEIRDALAHEWTGYVSSVLEEAILVPIPNEPTTASAFVHEIGLDGLILSGGNDLGDAPKRDKTEKVLFQTCLDKKLPILGVCRGFQAINVFLGGKVQSELSVATSTNHVSRNHEIQIRGDLFAAGVDGSILEVNSFHNQGVRRQDVAPAMQIIAEAPDQIVEAFLHPDKRVLGVQWHPERTNPSRSFDEFLLRQLFFEGQIWPECNGEAAG